jgi:hypothetical protein
VENTGENLGDCLEFLVEGALPDAAAAAQQLAADRTAQQKQRRAEDRAIVRMLGPDAIVLLNPPEAK